MRFTLPTLWSLILLTSHQALALPAESPSKEDSKKFSWSVPRTDPHDVAAHQMLDSRAVDVEAIHGHDTRSLQARALPWQSTELKRRLVVGLSTAVATGIHLTNNALTWKISMQYSQDSDGKGTISGSYYQDGETKLDAMDLCANAFTQTLIGNTAGYLWMQGNLDLEGSYFDSKSGNLVTMFWT